VNLAIRWTEKLGLYIKITAKIGIDLLRQVHMIMNLLDVIIKMVAVENKFYYYLQFMLPI